MYYGHVKRSMLVEMRKELSYNKQQGCAGLLHTLQHDELLGVDRRRGSRDNVEDISDDSGYTRKNSRDNVTDISR
jgi:hypothetical protein